MSRMKNIIAWWLRDLIAGQVAAETRWLHERITKLQKRAEQLETDVERIQSEWLKQL